MLTWGSIIMGIFGLIDVALGRLDSATTAFLVAILLAIWDFQEKFFTQEKKETK